MIQSGVWPAADKCLYCPMFMGGVLGGSNLSSVSVGVELFVRWDSKWYMGLSSRDELKKPASDPVSDGEFKLE